MQRMTLADYLSSDEEIAAFLHQRLAGFAEGVRANPAVIETANRIFNEIPLLAVTDPPRDFIVSQPFWFEAQSLAANISSSLSIAYANDENAKPTKKKFASYQELVETLLNESLNEFVHHAFLAACEDILGSNGEIREDLRQCFTTAGLTDQAILRDSRFKLPLLTGYVSLLICGSTAFQELLVALDAKVDCADEAMPVNAVYAMVVAYVHAAMDQLAMKLNNKEIEIDKNTIKIITYCFMEDKEEVRRRAYDKLLPELAEPKLVLWSADEINGNVERFYAMLSDMEEANEAGRLGVFLNLAYPGLTFPLHYILSTAVSVEDLRKKMAASQNRINEFENQLVYRNHAFAEYYNYLPYKLRVLLLCMEWQFKTTKNRELCPNMDDYQKGMKAQADTQQIWAEMTARFSDRRLRECWETFKTDRPKFAAFVDLFTRLEMLDCHDEKRNSDKALLLKEIRGKVEALRKAHQNVIDREESYGLLKLEYEGRLQDFFPPEEKSAYAGLRKALVSIEYLRKLIETDELTEREDLLQTAIDINEAFVRLDNFLQTRVPVRRVEENEQGLLIEDEGGSNAEGGVEVVSAMTTDDLLVDILAPLINNEFRMFITSHSILASLNELVESKIWKMLDDPAAPPIAAKTRQNLWRIIRAISQIRKEQLAQCRLEYINPAEISLEEAQFIFRHRLETVSSDIDEAKSAGTDVQRLEGLLKGYQQQAADLDGRMDMSQAEKIKSLLELAGYVLKVTESSASTYGDKKSVSESGSQQDATGAVKVIDIFELNDINYLNIESIRDIMTELRALPESPERSDRLQAAQFMLSCVGVLNDEAIKPSHKRKLLIEILQFQHDLSISLPINMSGCNFGGEELCFITRSNMNMSGVNFNRATIRDCDFESSRFPGALLSGSIITASRFANECEFVKCPFIEAQLIGVYFNHSTFEEVDFSSASLVDVHFDDATLEDVCFVNVDLSSVTFNNATFSRVQFIPFVNKFTEAAWLELFSEWSRLGIPAETRFYNIYRNLKECNEYTAEEAVRVLTLHQEYKFEKLPSQIMHATLYQPRSEGKADTPIPSQISPRGDK